MSTIGFIKDSQKFDEQFLSACYAYAVIFVCRFAEGFYFTVSKSYFYTLFYFGIFLKL